MGWIIGCAALIVLIAIAKRWGPPAGGYATNHQREYLRDLVQKTRATGIDPEDPGLSKEHASEMITLLADARTAERALENSE